MTNELGLLILSLENQWRDVKNAVGADTWAKLISALEVLQSNLDKAPNARRAAEKAYTDLHKVCTDHPALAALLPGAHGQRPLASPHSPALERSVVGSEDTYTVNRLLVLLNKMKGQETAAASPPQPDEVSQQAGGREAGR